MVNTKRTGRYRIKHKYNSDTERIPVKNIAHANARHKYRHNVIFADMSKQLFIHRHKQTHYLIIDDGGMGSTKVLISNGVRPSNITVVNDDCLITTAINAEYKTNVVTGRIENLMHDIVATNQPNACYIDVSSAYKDMSFLIPYLLYTKHNQVVLAATMGFPRRERGLNNRKYFAGIKRKIIEDIHMMNFYNRHTKSPYLNYEEDIMYPDLVMKVYKGYSSKTPMLFMCVRLKRQL